MKDNFVLKNGKFEVFSLGKKIDYDENGKPIRKKKLGEFKNLIVETGKELVADIMVNKITLYTNGIYLKYMAVGTNNTPANIDDWKLNTEQTRVLVQASDMERITNTSIARYSGIFPSGGGTYTILEAGMFLSVTEPSSDPQLTPAQRANAMFCRAVHPSGIVKNNADNVEITYDIHF